MKRTSRRTHLFWNPNCKRRSRKRFSDSRKHSEWRSCCAGITSLATNKSPRFSIYRCRPSKAYFFARAQNSVPGSANISISPSNRVSPALFVLKDSTSDAACFGVMSQHMHASIAPAKKCAQNPADEADHNRAPECTPEAVYMKSDNNTGYQK